MNLKHTLGYSSKAFLLGPRFELYARKAGNKIEAPCQNVDLPPMYRSTHKYVIM